MEINSEMTREITLFISFNLIEEFISPSVRANDIAMADIFLNKFKIDPLDKFEITSTEITDTCYEFNFNHDSEKKYSLYCIRLQKHAIKLLVCHSEKMIVFVNSGFGVEFNNNNIFLTLNYDKLNDIISDIINSFSLLDLYTKLKIYKKKVEQINEIQEQYCNLQLSGSCTYFSMLYALYILIFYFNNKNLDSVNNYKMKLNKQVVLFVNEINIISHVNSLLNKSKCQIYNINFLYNLSLIKRKYEGEFKNLSDIDKHINSMYFINDYCSTDKKILYSPEGLNITNFDNFDVKFGMYYYLFKWYSVKDKTDIKYINHVKSKITEVGYKFNIFYFLLSLMHIKYCDNCFVEGLSEEDDYGPPTLSDKEYNFEYLSIINKYVFALAMFDKINLILNNAEEINLFFLFCNKLITNQKNYIFFGLIFILIFRVLENNDKFEFIATPFIHQHSANWKTVYNFLFGDNKKYIECSRYINKLFSHTIKNIDNHGKLQDCLNILLNNYIHPDHLEGSFEINLSYDLFDNHVKNSKVKNIYINKGTIIYQQNEHKNIRLIYSNNYVSSTNITILNKKDPKILTTNDVSKFICETHSIFFPSIYVEFEDGTKIYYDTIQNNSNSDINMSHHKENTFIDPLTSFEISNDLFDIIKFHNNEMLIPTTIHNDYNTINYYSCFIDENNNIYMEMKNSFIKKFKEQNFELLYDKSSLNKIVTIQLYMLFYGLYEDILVEDVQYKKNMEFMKNNIHKICIFDPIYNCINPNIENIDEYQKYYEQIKSKYINDFFSLDQTIKSNMDISFIDMLFLNIIAKIIHLLPNKFYDYSLKNIKIDANNNIYYEHKNIKFISNTSINSDNKFNKYTVKFKNIDDSRNNNIMYFSDIYPWLTEINGNVCLYENTEYVYNDSNKKTSFIYIQNSSCFCFTNIYKNNNRFYYYDWTTYFTKKIYYETFDGTQNYIYDDEIIINNYTPRIGVSNTKYNYKIVVTNKNKLRIFITETVIKYLLSDDDNIYGLELELIKNINMFKLFFTEIEKNISKNLIFEYDIKTQNNNGNIEIIDINLDKNNTKTFLLFLILTKNHAYELTKLLFNKFVSLIDNLNWIFYKINNPFGFKINQLINNHLPNDEFDSELRKNERRYTVINDNMEKFHLNDYHIKVIENTFDDNFINSQKLYHNFENYRIIKKNETQKNCIDTIINNINEEKNIVYEIMMGSGKSKLIIPYISLYFSILKLNQIVIVAPEHLIDELYNDILSNSNFMSLCIIKKIDKLNTEYINDSYIENLNNGIVIMSDKLAKNLLLDKPEIYSNKKGNRYFIIDEIDDCINPLKSNFNIINEEKTIKEIMAGEKNYDKLVDFIIEFVENVDVIKKSKRQKRSKAREIFTEIFEGNTVLLEKLKCICCFCEEKCNMLSGKNKNEIYFLKKIYDAIEIIIENKFIYNKDYGLNDDFHKNSFFYAIPYKYIGTPSRESEFNDIFITLILTTQIFLQTPFYSYRDRDLTTFIIKVISNGDDSVNEEIKQHCINFFNFNDSKKYQNIDYFRGQMKNMNGEYGKKLQYYFLKKIAIDKIKYIISYKNTSFLELLNKNIYKNCIGFSGTTDYIDKIMINSVYNYPLIKEDPIFSVTKDFSTQTDKMPILKIMMAQHTNISDDDNFFNELNDYNERHKDNIINCIIDTGALFRFKSNLDYAKMFLNKIATCEYVIFYNENTTYCINREEMTNINNEKLFEIEISKDKIYDKTTKNNKFIMFFDNVHTRGSDLKLPINTVGIITISNICDSVIVMQGVYRLREFGNNQKCVFFVSKELNIQMGELYDFLILNTEKYKKDQYADLVLQTIYANYKWMTDEYKICNLDIPLIPIFKPKERIINLMKKNYNLIKKKEQYCIESNRTIQNYCGLLNKKNIKKYDIMQSISVGISKSISRSLSKSVTISQNVDGYHKYINGVPLSTSHKELLNHSDDQTQSYLSMLSYKHFYSKN